MTEPSRPKVHRFKYKERCSLAPCAVAATPLAYPAIATAADEWDIGIYDRCIQEQGDSTIAQHFCLRALPAEFGFRAKWLRQQQR